MLWICHSQKSNWFSPDGAVRQNWCILRRNDKYKKFRVFPEVCDSGIFETSEPKTEPPEWPKPWGLASKFEKSMFFGPVSLNIIQNFIFKVSVEENNSCPHFDIYKRSPKRSPWSPEAKNTLKI